MPAASATRPISPSSASTSRTRWPLPRPPIAGLQDIAPMVAKRCVTSAVVAPVRAAALAASQPAWPPPITMTSHDFGREIMRGFYRGARKPGRRKVRCQNVSRETSAHTCMERHMFHAKRFRVKRFVKVNKTILLTYAKIPEDHIEQVFHIDPPKQLAQ